MSDAIIVLARGIASDGTLPIDPISRVKKAAELYRAGKAPKIIMAGRYSFHLDQAPPTSEAHAMKLYAETLGIESEDIIEEDRSTHTLANAYFTKKAICEPNSWHNLTVVASDEHMPRVKYLFRKVYGEDYSFDFVISDRVINDEEYGEELEHEKSSMELSRKWLDALTDGDDEAIRQLVISKRPNDTMSESL